MPNHTFDDFEHFRMHLVPQEVGISMPATTNGEKADMHSNFSLTKGNGGYYPLYQLWRTVAKMVQLQVLDVPLYDKSQ